MKAERKLEEKIKEEKAYKEETYQIGIKAIMESKKNWPKSKYAKGLDVGFDNTEKKL